MKKIYFWLILSSVCGGANIVAQAGEPGAPNIQVVERSRDSEVVQRVSQQVLENGQIVLTTNNAYTVLATGLNYWDGEWKRTNPRFTLQPGQAVASEGPFQLRVASDIALEGSIDVITPDGKRFVSNPRWLVYNNLITHEATMIAAVKSCVGQLVAPNVIVFSDAFDEIQASIRVTYKPYGVEQEVVILQRLDPADWGMNVNGNPADLVLEMWSEQLIFPEPEHVTLGMQEGMSDVKIEFGEATIGVGKAFSVNDEDTSIGVSKSWIRIDQRQDN